MQNNFHPSVWGRGFLERAEGLGAWRRGWEHGGLGAWRVDAIRPEAARAQGTGALEGTGQTKILLCVL